jgi:hypothetical protein
VACHAVPFKVGEFSDGHSFRPLSESQKFYEEHFTFESNITPYSVVSPDSADESISKTVKLMAEVFEKKCKLEKDFKIGDSITWKCKELINYKSMTKDAKSIQPKDGLSNFEILADILMKTPMKFIGHKDTSYHQGISPTIMKDANENTQVTCAIQVSENKWKIEEIDLYRITKTKPTN